MKTLLVTLALATIALPSSAALQYDFMLKNTSDDASKGSADMTGRALVDGFRSRVEFISGSLYPPNTYVLSTDSTGRLYFVDPAKQWFTEINTAGIATALGASNIKIENLKSTAETLTDRRKIAGIDADHYKITLSYDITVVMKTIPIKQHVETEIDSWTTTRFGDVPQNFLSRSMRTGNVELDRLLEAESAKVGGFPLRQLVTTRTSYEKPARTKINRPSTRTMTRETWVTRIQELPAADAQFTIPATYRRAEQAEVPRTQAQTLTFDPPSK
jgi:hypothetical protein